MRQQFTLIAAALAAFAESKPVQYHAQPFVPAARNVLDKRQATVFDRVVCGNWPTASRRDTLEQSVVNLEDEGDLPVPVRMLERKRPKTS